MLLVLGPDAIDIWLMDPTTLPGGWLDEHRAVLSAEEAERAERGDPRARHAFGCARVMSRRILSRYADVEPRAWRFETGAAGKPAIAAPAASSDLRFNLSHTQGLIAVAVSRLDVGIDVEAVDQAFDILGIARHVFAPEEREDLARFGERERSAWAFRLWTLKEAILKARGHGLTTPLETVIVRIAADGALIPPVTEGPWRCRFSVSCPTPIHVLAVVGLAPSGPTGPGPVRTRWWFRDDRP